MFSGFLKDPFLTSNFADVVVPTYVVWLDWSDSAASAK